MSRWERAENDIDSNAEALIRLFAAERLSLDAVLGVGEVAEWCVPGEDERSIVIDGTDPANYRSKPLVDAA